ncbi:MAG: hypothetical protein HFI67_03260, partial [Lachnospiraceae bacterium]|nr:hypothetical protein [Lachnospiraceae bacterium]
MIVDQEILGFLVKEFRLVSKDGMILKPITEGLSEAEVYLLIINNAVRARDNGNYILKIIDTTSPWFLKNDNESNKAETIYANSTHYQQHLVKVRTKKYIDDKLVIVYFYLSLTRAYKTQQFNGLSTLRKAPLPPKRSGVFVYLLDTVICSLKGR